MERRHEDRNGKQFTRHGHLGTTIANPNVETIATTEAGEPLPPEMELKPPIATRIKGISLMVLTSIAATTQGSIVKYVNDLETGMIILIVAIYSFCYFCVLITHQGISVTDFPKKKWVALTVAFGTASYVCKVWSFQNLPLGDASALVFTSPLFTCVLARIFIKEKFTPITIISLLMGLGGVILIAKPTFIFRLDGREFPWYYILVALLSAFSRGVLYVLQRKIAAHVSSITVSFYLGVAQLFAGLGWQVLSGDEYRAPFCHQARILLVLCGLCILIVWVASNVALKYEKATISSIIRNLDTVFAFFVQVVIFEVPAESLSLIGAALIIGGTMSVTLSKVFNFTCGVKF